MFSYGQYLSNEPEDLNTDDISFLDKILFHNFVLNKKHFFLEKWFLREKFHIFIFHSNGSTNFSSEKFSFTTFQVNLAFKKNKKEYQKRTRLDQGPH